MEPSLMQLNHLDLEQLFDLPCHVYWKDRKGVYLGSNDYPEKKLGINKLIFTGHRDQELLQQEAAAVILQNDHYVIKNNTTLSIHENAQWLNKTFIDYSVISYKQPLYSKSGKIIGLIGFSFMLPMGNTISDGTMAMRFVSGQALAKKNKPNNQPKHHPTSEKSLTARQLECLYYLVLGKTAKEIGTLLGLSKRTVEHHLEHLKLKYHCESRSALVAKALKMSVIREKILSSTT